MKTPMKNTGMKLNLMAVILAFSVLFFAACKDDDADTTNKRDFNVEATDAPIDHAEVDAVFMTVSDIKVDGQSLEGFQRTTLEVSALTEGKTELLKQASLDASSVNEIEIVFDYEMDDAGQSPGCYVLKLDGTKDKIQSSAESIQIMKTVDLAASSATTVVLDFDLRKIVRDNNGDFELATEGELESNIRAVVKSNAGKVEGQMEGPTTTGGKLVAYLYKEGEFNASTEMQGQGSSSIQFANAVNSAEVNADGSFTIAFVEEGMYELHVFEYTDDDSDGQMELTGEAELESLNSITVDGFNVSAESSVDLQLKITTLIVL